MQREVMEIWSPAREPTDATDGIMMDGECIRIRVRRRKKRKPLGKRALAEKRRQAVERRRLARKALST
jgi:hypothetical protein